jgi:hypothetical protein
MRSSARYVISRLDQKQAIASPMRQELLDVLSGSDAVSLAELGAALGRPADGLYYHVRQLVRVGLVRSAGQRTRRDGRREALFAAVARQFTIRYAPSTAPHVQSMNAVVAAMLRLGMRDFRRALIGGATRLEGPARDLWALRTIGWLRPEHVRQVNRGIRDLSRTATRHVPHGRLYAVTVLLTPLDHRANRTGRRPRKGAGAARRARSARRA